MGPVLLLIDTQKDMVEDPRLVPAARNFLTRIGAILHHFREHQRPILHAHYITDDPDQMPLPTRAASERPRCVAGTPGAAPSEEAMPQSGEHVVENNRQSALAASDLKEALARLAPNPLVICGLHEHTRVRQTALEALDEGYNVCVIADAVASCDPLHAQLTRTFLIESNVQYMEWGQFLDQLESGLRRSVPGPQSPEEFTHPAACVDGRWISGSQNRVFEHRNPCDWNEVLDLVPIAGPEIVDSAVKSAEQAQRAWGRQSLERRLELVKKWAGLLEEREESLARTAAREVAKPLRQMRGEMAFLRRALQVIIECCAAEPQRRAYARRGDVSAFARRCPVGVVAIITPWNNPAFLPVAKVAGAIALGNAAILKPSLECPKTTIELQNSLLETGIPPGLVNVVFGDGATAQHIIGHRGVRAVTLTGSVRTGQHAAARCGSLVKPIQAELGGNNVALVTQACDWDKVAQEVAHHAFDYAGQGCTATRRIVVVGENNDDGFVEKLKEATRALVVGEPLSEATDLGPVISRGQQRRIQTIIAESQTTGVRMFTADLSHELVERGCWLPPRIVQGLDAMHPLVQEETFAPVVVVQSAPDLAGAFRLCNNVSQGLVGSIYCNDEAVRQKFRDAIETGVVRLNLPTRGIHLEAPFGGWKNSSLGVPEHGVWDLDFYTRWQAVYERETAL